jgi:cytochrome c556
VQDEFRLRPGRKTFLEESMRLSLGILAVAVGIVSTAASATDDPIQTRKKLMQANGGAAGIAQGMIKEEIPFSPVLAESALRTFNAVSYAFGDYFPEGSDKGDTRASPKIWEEMAEFQGYLADFQADTDAARAAKPQDLEAFKAAMAEIGQNCQHCHEDFRLEEK